MTPRSAFRRPAAPATGVRRTKVVRVHCIDADATDSSSSDEEGRGARPLAKRHVQEIRVEVGRRRAATLTGVGSESFGGSPRGGGQRRSAIQRRGSGSGWGLSTRRRRRPRRSRAGQTPFDFFGDADVFGLSIERLHYTTELYSPSLLRREGDITELAGSEADDFLVELGAVSF
ncbi:hypothetical protein ZIOFF_004840 [Zingiber officinale]|uniref:Uncharacterized protein n=1 Tax=Zingiber officinale TaxID=94328 RepID=A0A8J5LM64_ZINOF|nr:hypothetical protein ZIOFF_004840 [Zingiber officinale]